MAEVDEEGDQRLGEVGVVFDDEQVRHGERASRPRRAPSASRTRSSFRRRARTGRPPSLRGPRRSSSRSRARARCPPASCAPTARNRPLEHGLLRSHREPGPVVSHLDAYRAGLLGDVKADPEHLGSRPLDHVLPTRCPRGCGARCPGAPGARRRAAREGLGRRGARRSPPRPRGRGDPSTTCSRDVAELGPLPPATGWPPARARNSSSATITASIRSICWAALSTAPLRAGPGRLPPARGSPRAAWTALRADPSDRARPAPRTPPARPTRSRRKRSWIVRVAVRLPEEAQQVIARPRPWLGDQRDGEHRPA